MHGLFMGSDINSIELQNDYNYEISDYSNMFQNCKKLTSADLSKFNFFNAQKLNNIFSGCYNLQYISLPKNTSLNNFENCDFSEMFSNCTSLISIDLSDISFNRLNNLNNTFSNCLNIESITLKGKVEMNLDFGESSVASTALNGEEYYTDITEITDIEENIIKIFPVVNKIRRLNLFDLEMNVNEIDLNDLNTLEECLYYEHDSNIKRCSKYMGFHHCGNCNNEDNDYYCTKIIDGDEFNFYYLEHELNKLPIKENIKYI
jgi:hypothetical protein